MPRRWSRWRTIGISSLFSRRQAKSPVRKLLSAADLPILRSRVSPLRPSIWQFDVGRSGDFTDFDLVFRLTDSGKESALPCLKACFVATIGLVINYGAVIAGESAWHCLRPCGPDSVPGPLRLLIPQGACNADFRPVCRRHDRCYGTWGSDREACDRCLYNGFSCACRESKSPVLCRITAALMYLNVRAFGQRAFVVAQNEANGSQTRHCQAASTRGRPSRN